MKPIQKIFKLNSKEYHQKHLSILSCLVNTKLTPKEIEVLSCFLSLDKSITEGDMFNTIARKKVKTILGGMSSGGLGNHLRSMSEKKVLIKEDKMRVNELLLPRESVQGYQIKLILDDNE